MKTFTRLLVAVLIIIGIYSYPHFIPSQLDTPEIIEDREEQIVEEVPDNLVIKEGGAYTSPNEIGLYPDSPLLSEDRYQDPQYLRTSTINGLKEMGGRLTNDNTIESNYYITGTITEFSTEQSRGDETIKTIELCTPDSCATLSPENLQASVLEYFGEHTYFVGPNYFLLRVFTEETLYQHLITIHYYDITNTRAADYDGARWRLDTTDRKYQKKLQVCYEMQDEAARSECLDIAKADYTILLRDSCDYEPGVYNRYLDITSPLGDNSETMSWMRHEDLTYYVAQHSDNQEYAGCENEDHVVSFNVFSCTTQETKQLYVYENLGSARLTICGIQLAGILNEDQIVYATQAYEGPYCAVAESYNIMDPTTQEVTQIRLLPENINAALAAEANFVMLDYVASQKWYQDIQDIYRTTIGDPLECGAGQYQITDIDDDEITVTWSFGGYREQNKDEFYSLEKKFRLMYEDGILSIK